MAAIHDLPIELLSCIFAFLYARHTKVKELPIWMYEVDETGKSRGPKGLVGPRYLQTTWSDHDLYNPSLFPCAVARVCQLWLNVMMRNAHYWTRFAFDLAAVEPLLLDAFLWSNDLPFDMLVFDSRVSCAAHPQDNEAASAELAHAGAVVSRLMPHLGRCHSLHFDVLYASSLPPLPAVLQHCSQTMAELKLDYRTHSSTTIPCNPCSGRTAVAPSANFIFLTYLSLDVQTFMHLTQLYPRWSNNLRRCAYLTLEISKYAFRDSEESGDSSKYSTKEFFSQLHKMITIPKLILSDLSLIHGIDQNPQMTTKKPRLALRNLGSIVAKNLSEEFLHALFRDCSLHVAAGVFDGCIFPRDIYDVGFYYLTFKNIPRNAKLERVLELWSGDELWIDSCPCFDDTVVDYLSKVTGSNGACPSPGLRSLSIHNCDNFTFALIKRLVEMRKELGRTSADDDPDVLDSLSVSGRSPPLSQEELLWFQTHLTNVRSPLS